MKYRVEYFPNPNCATIHVSKRIVDTHAEYYDIGFKVAKFSSSFSKSTVQELANDVATVDGIVKISVSPYELHMVKAEVFDWKDILTPVINILHNHLEPESDLEEQGPPKEAPRITMGPREQEEVSWLMRWLEDELDALD